jgi:plasmid stability protein
MPDILVRDLPVELKKEIERRAREHGQSLSAEMRLLIERGIKAESASEGGSGRPASGMGDQLAALAATLGPDGLGDLPIPSRNEPDRPPPDFE